MCVILEKNKKAKIRAKARFSPRNYARFSPPRVPRFGVMLVRKYWVLN
jgi:hypothetical protein